MSERWPLRRHAMFPYQEYFLKATISSGIGIRMCNLHATVECVGKATARPFAKETPEERNSAWLPTSTLTNLRRSDSGAKDDGKWSTVTKNSRSRAYARRKECKNSRRHYDWWGEGKRSMGKASCCRHGRLWICSCNKKPPPGDHQLVL